MKIIHYLNQSVRQTELAYQFQLFLVSLLVEKVGHFGELFGQLSAFPVRPVRSTAHILVAEIVVALQIIVPGTYILETINKNDFNLILLFLKTN